MKITGTWNAFEEYMDHLSVVQYSPICYTKRANGTVETILLNNRTEWVFPTTEKVTEAQISHFGSTQIEVKSWSNV